MADEGSDTESPANGAAQVGPEPLAIATADLTKCYGQHTALKRCSLEVRRGEVFGLLGPNGAGKSTLLRVLLGFLRATSGEARVDGLDCQRESIEIRRRTAYLPGDARLFISMTGAAVMRFFQEMRGGDPKRYQRMAERLQVDLRRRVAFMSTGMRQKVALASVLAAPARIFILDEPTANLDPTVRAEALQIVRQLQAEGATVVFSSHVLSEIEAVCDRVAILKAGELVCLEDLHELALTHWIRLATDEPSSLRPPDTLLETAESSTVRETSAEFVVAGELSPWLEWLASAGPRRVRVEPVGLEAVYHRHHPKQSLVSLDA